MPKGVVEMRAPLRKKAGAAFQDRRGWMAFVRRKALVHGLVVALFAAGMVAGYVSVQGMDQQRREELHRYIQELTADPAPRGGAGALVQQAALEYVVKTVGLMWILGLSIIGAPFILGVLFMRGYALGFTTGFLIEERLWEGVVLFLVAVLPHQLLMVPGILLAGAGAVSFSAVIAAIVFGRRDLSAFRQFLSTTGLCLLSALLLLAGSLVEGYITPILVQAVGRHLPLW